MSLKTFYRVSSLIKHGNRLLSGPLSDAELVSFDMFDTLLVRRTHDPDLVKVPVARLISNLAKQQGIDIEWKQVQEKRDELEQALREQTGQTFEDKEAHYPTLMSQTLTAILGEDEGKARLQEVTDFEMQMENTMLVPGKEIVEWLEQLARRGTRMWVISDMYLPADHLEVLLSHAGLSGYFEKVISSADSFLAKASGKGYAGILKDQDINGEKWLHIGDNPISDGFRADEAGLHALVLQDYEEHRRKAIAARYYYYGLGRGFWKGRAAQQLMAPIEAENVPRSAMYREGYNFFGPLLCSFVQKVAERSIQQGITKVFFLSREGWMFKQLWEKITPVLYPGAKLPEIEYLYVSRLALASATCAHQGLTPENARIVFLPPGNKSFEDVARIFGLDKNRFESHLERHKLTTTTTLSPLHTGFDPEHLWRFREMLKDDLFQQEIKSQSRESNDALQKYLEDVGFFDHKEVALVDIGWLGTIQRFFNDAIAHRDRPTCHGLLFGATRGITFPANRHSYLEGVMYDREKFNLASSAILYARDLFEEACRAPYPTLNGYRLNLDGSYKLEFRQMTDHIGKSEQEQDRYYADLQQGVLDAADRFGPAVALITNHCEDLTPWTNYLLMSKLAFPKRKEIRTIRYMHHLDDFQGSNTPNLLRRPKLLHNPWEVRGWRFWLGTLFAGRLFKKHLRVTINSWPPQERL
ncbi:MAG: HAD hydrolase-like protein [Gammaproteobacteria bacterium]|nr:HAD hydrolase-like protein [Gammaproteobacteria bacterium]